MKKIKNLIAACLCAVLMFSAVGCTPHIVDENFTDDLSQFYEIKMMIPVVSMPEKKAANAVIQKINQVLKQKINAGITLEYYMLNEFNGQASARIGSGEPVDLVWTNAANFYTFLEAEALYPLDKLIDKYAPDVKKEFDAQLWNQVRHSDGKIYAIPNLQILPRTAGISFRDEDLFIEFMAAELGDSTLTEKVFAQQEIIINDYCTALTLENKFKLLEDYMDYLKSTGQGNGGLAYGLMLNFFLETFLGYDDLTLGAGIPGVVSAYDDGTDGIKVFNQFETPEFKYIVEKMVEWQNKGYIPSDILQGSYDNTRLDLVPASTWKPSYRTERNVKEGVDYVKKYETVFKFGTPHYLQSYIQGTMWTVSATSDNPARSLSLVELLFNDSEVHDLFKYGIKDVNYTLVNDEKQAKTTDRSGYTAPIPGWCLGNQFIGTPADFEAVDVFEQMAKVNDETKVSAVIGFVFDRNPVLTEIQNCSAISVDYMSRFEHGIDLKSNPNLLSEFISKLESGGATKIIKEKERQINAWLAK